MGGGLEERNVRIPLWAGRESVDHKWLSTALQTTGLRLFVSPHRTCSLTLQLPVLSGLPFESSPATFLDGVQGIFLVKNLFDVLGVSRRQLSDLFRRTTAEIPSPAVQVGPLESSFNYLQSPTFCEVSEH